jgi:hypothetical protein
VRPASAATVQVPAAPSSGERGGIDGAPADRYTGALTVTLPPRYKAALAGLFLLLPALGLADLRVAGAAMPDGAEKVAENRYRSAKSWDETIRFYRQVYPARYTRRPVADQPSVKAVHIDNPDARPGVWEGVNIYEAKGAVRIFVLVKRK